MSNKTVTVKAKRVKIINESKLDLPQDVDGFSTNFRREAARAIGRIQNDERRLECFKELAAIFVQYAEDRFEQNQKELKVALEAKAKQRKLAAEKAKREADAVIKSKRALAEQLTAELKAHDKAQAELEAK